MNTFMLRVIALPSSLILLGDLAGDPVKEQFKEINAKTDMGMLRLGPNLS